MRLADFDYVLPAELIAQHPLAERDRARMMIVNRAAGTISHSSFAALPLLLGQGDVLVVNDSKVVPAHMTGRKETGGVVELLLLEQTAVLSPSCESWEALLKPAHRVRPGMWVRFGEEGEALIGKRLTAKKWELTIYARTSVTALRERQGQVPLPPYIKRPAGTEDVVAYQTIYARTPGSVAAPTAGLHFTPAVLGQLAAAGVPVAAVTLHVGYGTFAPVTAEAVEEHTMEEESYVIGAKSASLINTASRVVAVGTTSTRVLESAADEHGVVTPRLGRTRLFIYPGYRFRRVDALLTNFHLPRSSLYLLVCAFAGRELIERAYAAALAECYRFCSYGDCMLIL